jgi:hypothetical protein
LPAIPIDLTIGQGGDLYVLTFENRDRVMVREVRRYRQDCTPVATWDLERLNGPVASLTPIQTPAATMIATDTATSRPPASDTPTPDVPPGTFTPTETYTPCDYGWEVLLPVAVRGDG